jgi:hypothetical protein
MPSVCGLADLPPGGMILLPPYVEGQLDPRLVLTDTDSLSQRVKSLSLSSWVELILSDFIQSDFILSLSILSDSS